MANPILEQLGAGLVGGTGFQRGKRAAKLAPKATAAPPPQVPFTYESAQAQLLDLLQNPVDQYSEDYGAYLSKVEALQLAMDYLDPTKQPGYTEPGSVSDPNAWRDRINPNETLIAEQQAKNAEIQSRIALDEIGINRAISELDAFLEGQAESRSRANLVQEGQKMRQQYGTSNGKTDFSLADLGAGFAAMAGPMGIDPNAAFVRYPGVMDVNPEADLARFDAQGGVTGLPPEIPGLTVTQGDIPTAPALDHDWFNLPPGSGGDIIVNGPQAAAPPAPMPQTTAPLDIPAMVGGKGVGKQPGQVQYNWGSPSYVTPQADWDFRHGQKPSGVPGGRSF